MMYDVIIVGGGPAGLTAGIYSVRNGLRTLILEKETIGGAIASSPRIDNYPGYESISGQEFSSKLYNQAKNQGVTIELEEALEIKNDKVKTVITDYNEYKCKALIMATGSKYKHLNLPNEEKFIGNGISFCTLCDGAFFKGQDVCVVGGANSAVINAIYLSSICKNVYLIVRKEYLKCEESLKEEVYSKENVKVYFNSNVKELKGKETLESIVIDNNEKEEELKIEGLFVSIGQEAQTQLCKNLVDLSSNNYINSDDTLTNIDGIFACGDCIEKKVKQVTTAVSDGTIAAINAYNYIKKEFDLNERDKG